MRRWVALPLLAVGLHGAWAVAGEPVQTPQELDVARRFSEFEPRFEKVSQDLFDAARGGDLEGVSEAAVRLAVAYELFEMLGAPDWTVAGWVRSGQILERLADALEAEARTAQNCDAAGRLRGRSALRHYSTALDRSWKGALGDSEWTKLARERWQLLYASVGCRTSEDCPSADYLCMQGACAFTDSERAPVEAPRRR